MKYRDVMSGSFWGIFGLLFVIGALQHGLVERGLPGRGAFPFLVGSALVLLSLVDLVPAVLKVIKSDKSGPGESFFPEESSGRKLLLATAILFFYGFSLRTLGFPLTTFVFLLLVSKAIEPQPWRSTFIFALATTIISSPILRNDKEL